MYIRAGVLLLGVLLAGLAVSLVMADFKLLKNKLKGHRTFLSTLVKRALPAIDSDGLDDTLTNKLKSELKYIESRLECMDEVFNPIVHGVFPDLFYMGGGKFAKIRENREILFSNFRTCHVRAFRHSLRYLQIPRFCFRYLRNRKILKVKKKSQKKVF